MRRFDFSRGARRSAGMLVSIAALIAPAAAATTVQIPGTYSLDVNGVGLAITNSFVDTSGAGRPPVAIAGRGSGTRGIGIWGISPALYGMGVVGEATGADSVGVYGENSLTGDAGRFLLTGAAANAGSTAVWGQNAGGSAAKRGAYGNAGVFQVSNAQNTSAAVSVSTNGIDSYGLQVVNSGFTDLGITYPPSGDGGGIAGYFEINSARAQYGQAALLAVHSGGEKGNGSNGRYGNAGRFVITNKNNFDSVVAATTSSDQGTGVEGDDFSSGGGVALLGQSTNGLSAQFTGGSGGSGTCSYDGSSGWDCPSDRNLKDHLAVADPAAVLDRLDAMPIYYYQMKGSKLAVRYLGPTSQDFKAAFGLGGKETQINTANAQGVALAAAKGLYARLKRDEAKLAAQDIAIAALERRLARVESQH